MTMRPASRHMLLPTLLTLLLQAATDDATLQVESAPKIRPAVLFCTPRGPNQEPPGYHVDLGYLAALHDLPVGGFEALDPKLTVRRAV